MHFAGATKTAGKVKANIILIPTPYEALPFQEFNKLVFQVTVPFEPKLDDFHAPSTKRNLVSESSNGAKENETDPGRNLTTDWGCNIPRGCRGSPTTPGSRKKA